MRALHSLLLLSVLAPATCLAQSTGDATATSTAGALDLKLPEASPFAGDPPGTYYGDHAAPADATAQDQADDGKWQVHGAVTTGVAYSSKARGRDTGTFTGMDLNLSKRYTTDEGNTGGISLNISVAQGNGPGFGGPGWGYYGPPPRPMGPPPRPRADEQDGDGGQ